MFSFEIKLYKSNQYFPSIEKIIKIDLTECFKIFFLTPVPTDRTWSHFHMIPFLGSNFRCLIDLFGLALCVTFIHSS